MSCNNNFFAQGTIEYLVIMAIVVVIGLIVVGLMSSFFDSSSGISSSLNKLTVMSGVISISDLVVDSDGDVVFGLKNNSGETLTVVSIGAGGESETISAGMNLAGGGTFYVRGAENCACDIPGQKKSCTLVFSTTNRYGITETVSVVVEAECVGNAVPANPATTIAFQDGTATYPYLINSCVELQNISSNLTANYKLSSDVNCYGATHSGGELYNSGAGFDSIGDDSTPFSGIFDGDKHAISGLFINDSAWYTGLFGYNSGTVKNVAVKDVNVISTWYVGALIGSNEGIVRDTYSTGRLFASGGRGGGLIGHNQGQVYDSYSTVTLYGDRHSGGLIGYEIGNSIYNCFATGMVTGSDETGALVGKGMVTVTPSNAYFYDRGNPCVYDPLSNEGCTSEDSETHFYDLTNEPMVSWTNLSTNWTQQDSDYPKLKNES